MASDINRTELSSRLLIILSREVDVRASLQGFRTGKKTAAAPWLFFRAARDVSRKRLQWAAPPNPGRARESPTLAHSPTLGARRRPPVCRTPSRAPGHAEGTGRGRVSAPRQQGPRARPAAQRPSHGPGITASGSKGLGWLKLRNNQL